MTLLYSNSCNSVHTSNNDSCSFPFCSIFPLPCNNSNSSSSSSSSSSKGTSILLLLCFCATAVITLGVGIFSLHLPLTSDILRSHILSDILQSHLISPSAARQGPCNLFEGQWVPFAEGPLYRNGTCPVLTQTQNCQANGRPDTGYEHWRWQPKSCSLPRFDSRDFFRVMRGKTLAFVGDSVARNQMESLMCMLWQVEVPINRGSKKMQRWYFREHSVTVIRIWSAWLVNVTNEAWDFAPANLTKLQLDVPDDAYMDVLPRLDVLVISGGHWFAKRAAFLLGGRVVGGQLWADTRLPPNRTTSDEAFGIAMETAMRAVAGRAGYRGLTVLRTYSPDHYEGGAWNTGGSCTGKTRPAAPGELAFNAHTDDMRRRQLAAFARSRSHVSNGSKLRLLDVTPVFESRPDGHPGPYRSPDPNKITQRGPNGQPPPQDCLHWCMPGPIDTWNELLLQILREEL